MSVTLYCSATLHSTISDSGDWSHFWKDIPCLLGWAECAPSVWGESFITLFQLPTYDGEYTRSYHSQSGEQHGLKWRKKQMLRMYYI